MLGHAHTKLFISHSGNNGRYEAIDHGVPIIALLLFTEQPHNAFITASKGLGIHMNFYNFTAEKLTQHIKTAINECSLKKQQKKCVLKGLPPPKTLQLFWLEHVLVIKHGGAHVKSL